MTGRVQRTPLTREAAEQLRSETFYREVVLDRAAANADNRVFPASISSEFPVQRWFGKEILSHEDSAIDLSRAVDGALPMLFNHDTSLPIGSARGFKVKDARLHSELQFAKTSRAPEVYDQIAGNEVPYGISIGYRVAEWVERADSDEVTVTKWTLHEVSVVSVPADPSVGINRAIEENPPMTDEEKKRLEEGQRGTTAAPASLADAAPANVRITMMRGHEQGVAEERLRIAQIRELFLQPAFQTPEYSELERMCIDGGVSVEDTRTELLRMAGSGITSISAPPRPAMPAFAGPSERYQQPMSYPAQRALPPLQPMPMPMQRQFPGQPLMPQAPQFGGYPQGAMPHVYAGRDSMDLFYEGASRAIDLRAGLLKSSKERQEARNGNEFVGMTMAEVAGECLRRAGYDIRGFDKTAIVGMAFTAAPIGVRSIGSISHGTSDFANILLDAANKSLLAGWEEAEETYAAWVRTMNISDFKTNNLVNLSNFGDLDVIPEYGEYRYGTLSDLKETILLRTYGKLFSITRQAIINDDLSVFTSVPSRMGRAAKRMVGDEVYSVLTTNAALNQDSLALFHATHGNYVSTGGAAPSVTSLDAMFTAMATRTDPGGSTLNIRPRYIITPVALENTARTLVAAQYDPSASAGTLKPNPFQNRLEVISDARLDAFNSVGWFGAANPNQVGTVVVGFLDGREEPYLEQKEAFTQDGMAMKVRLDCRAVAEDFRGLYYNDGA